MNNSISAAQLLGTVMPFFSGDPQAHQVSSDPMHHKPDMPVLADALRSMLARASQLIGFEDIPLDTFHWGPRDTATPAPAILSVEAKTKESQVVSTFLRAILEGNDVRLHYRSPYKARATAYEVAPGGLVWDRDWWYLVGQRKDQKGEAMRFWRADRVLSIDLRPQRSRHQASFDVN